MVTSKSPLRVMRVAFEVGRRCLPSHSSKFSRHDFTLPQLFACLVLREHQKQTYRGLEALLLDTPQWCHEIGMSKVPDHNTLCRAFGVIVRRASLRRMLDLLVAWFAKLGKLKNLLAIDGSYYEERHASGYYKQRCRRIDRAKHPKTPDKRGSYTRSASVSVVPKLVIGVDTASHAVLAAQASSGMCGDGRSFEPILFHAWRRGRVVTVVADAGFDSEDNHRLARCDMNVKSIIPPLIGRPRKRGKPAGRHRRRMARKFQRDGGGRAYRQRAQVECVNSMMKRNLGSDLRCRSAQRRELEMLLRAVVHNIMLIRRLLRGSRQSRSGAVSSATP